MARDIFPTENQGRHYVFTGLLKNIAFRNYAEASMVVFSTPGKFCVGITTSFSRTDIHMRIVLALLTGLPLPCALTEAF